MKLSQKQLRKIISEITMTPDISGDVGRSIAQAIRDNIDTVTVAEWVMLHDDGLSRPVRYEDIEFYAQKIAVIVSNELKDDFETIAQSVLRGLMETEQ